LKRPTQCLQVCATHVASLFPLLVLVQAQLSPKYATIHHDGRKACTEQSARDQKVEFDLQYLAYCACACPAIISSQHDMAMYLNAMIHHYILPLLTE
jgi:hypothetical protein